MMRLIPSKKVCETFWITYDFKGCQKAVDLLTQHYRIRRMKIALDGRRMRKSWIACYDYDRRTAYFKKRALTKRNVLHELCHHLMEAKGLELSRQEEEKLASEYSGDVMRKARG
jgi:hypothetical protein